MFDISFYFNRAYIINYLVILFAILVLIFCFLTLYKGKSNVSKPKAPKLTEPRPIPTKKPIPPATPRRLPPLPPATSRRPPPLLSRPYYSEDDDRDKAIEGQFYVVYELNKKNYSMKFSSYLFITFIIIIISLIIIIS